MTEPQLVRATGPQQSGEGSHLDLVYLPRMQDIFGTASLDGRSLLVLAVFPIACGSDELRRWWLRRRDGSEAQL